jgi:hypothetical protein
MPEKIQKFANGSSTNRFWEFNPGFEGLTPVFRSIGQQLNQCADRGFSGILISWLDSIVTLSIFSTNEQSIKIPYIHAASVVHVAPLAPYDHHEMYHLSHCVLLPQAAHEPKFHTHHGPICDDDLRSWVSEQKSDWESLKTTFTTIQGNYHVY